MRGHAHQSLPQASAAFTTAYPSTTCMSAAAYVSLWVGCRLHT